MKPGNRFLPLLLVASLLSGCAAEGGSLTVGEDSGTMVPDAPLVVITPICPHTLNTRSVVLSGEDEVVVEMAAWKKDVLFRAEVNFDGGHAAMLRMGDRIRVARSQRTVKIVKISQVSFLEALHKKMSEK